MTAEPDRVVVVGFGAAGLAVCQELRALGWSGSLTVLSQELLAPYDRPPLTKDFLAGKVGRERLWLTSDAALAALDLDVRTGVRAVALDTGARVVTDSANDEHPYDALVIATGSEPRTLGIDVGAGVHILRTLPDAERLRADLAAARSVLVAGGGFLGFEVAATARTLGLEVTVVEPVSEPLRDRLGRQVARRLVDLHQERGVRVLTGIGVASVSPSTSGRQAEVVLVDGSRQHGDAVLISVGAAPDTGWLAGSGVEVGDGVLCDERCQAAPGVWAAGDVARWRHVALGTDVRIEHRMNATEQGRAVARGILGDRKPFAPVPFVWTDQYDVRIQVAGLAAEDLSPEILLGDERAESFAVEWRSERLACVAGWNAARQLMPARRELAETWQRLLPVNP